MDRGRTFYVSLCSGTLALILMLIGINLPTQLKFESRPFARAVLVSGRLRNWTAEQLGLEAGQFDVVKVHYTEFLKRNRHDGYSSESSDSDEEGGELFEHEEHLGNYQGNNTSDNIADIEAIDTNIAGDDGSSSSSSDDDDSDSSDSSSDSSSDESDGLTLAQRLETKPMLQTVGLGLFHGHICKTMKGSSQETCYSISTTEGIYLMNHEVSFMETDINMAIWNNLRVESLFSAFACIIGLVCLVTSLKPCCDNRRLPVYMGALAFCVSGVLVFIPIVRLLLVRSDFEQNLMRDYVVTTRLMTSWSLIASGFGIPFALVAGFSLITTKWIKASQKWYGLRKNKIDDERNGVRSRDVRMVDMNEREVRPAGGNDVVENSQTHHNTDESKRFID